MNTTPTIDNIVRSNAMLNPLRLEFQITLNDWLEFRRRELSVFRLCLLNLADGLWRPLLVLLVLSVLLVAATLSGLVRISFPTWLPIPILVLIAASRIYLSLPGISATRKAKNEWRQEAANVVCTVELSEDGFRYVAGPSTHEVRWSEIGSVFQTERVLIFCDEDDGHSLLIPKRSFCSETQLREFLDIAYQKTVVDRCSLHT